MGRCAFCGEEISFEGKGGLCGACASQVCALRCDSRAYGWYMRAVKRALLGWAAQDVLREPAGNMHKGRIRTI